jgi:hypothetical protein
MIEQIALVQLDFVAQVLDPLEVLRAGPANHSANSIPLGEEQFGQVTSVLTCDSGNKSGFWGHRCTRLSKKGWHPAI